MVTEMFEFLWFEQDSTAGLADGLQDSDDGPEIADVEHRQLEIDEAVMTDAIDEAEAASSAFSVFPTRSEATVQNAVGSRFSE